MTGRRTLAARAILTLCALFCGVAPAATPVVPSARPCTIDFYYKIRLGHFDEWMELYQRSHWPIMRAELQAGYIQKIDIVRPQSRWPEPNRWDLRVSITYRDALVAYGLTLTGREATLRRLFPDPQEHERDEKRRFELLEGQWEVALEPVDTAGWPGSPPVAGAQ